MLTSIIIELLETKMNECNLSNIKLIMHSYKSNNPASAEEFILSEEFMILSILITLKCTHLSAAICNFTNDTIKINLRNNIEY